MSDTLQLLGKLIEGEAGRDAVHIAVAPVTAAYLLYPGDRVSFLERGSDEVGRSEQPIGIVDPYLPDKILPGQRFYLFLFPQTITSLRHVWQHPAFPDETPVVVQKRDASVSEAWLREFCKHADCPGYERVMKVIENGSVSEDGYGGRLEYEYLHFTGNDAHGDIPDEFWVHAEVVLGRPISKKPKQFSCSC